MLLLEYAMESRGTVIPLIWLTYASSFIERTIGSVKNILLMLFAMLKMILKEWKNFGGARALSPFLPNFSVARASRRKKLYCFFQYQLEIKSMLM